jgi:hypothetical protein
MSSSLTDICRPPRLKVVKRNPDTALSAGIDDDDDGGGDGSVKSGRRSGKANFDTIL